MGSSSSTPRPGRASSCYLVSDGAVTIALDFGSGAFSSLRKVLDYAALDAVIVSHMHADHFLDLVPLRYALAYGPTRRATGLRVYLPPGGEGVLRGLAATIATSEPVAFYEPVVELHPYDPNGTLSFGGLTIRFARARHTLETYAMRVEGAGRTLAYSADTAPCSAIVELARGADLFLCEATLGSQPDDGERQLHATAEEAGSMARDAGVEHLVLTHYGSECDPAGMRAAARAVFRGRVTIADDGLEFSV